MDPKNQIKNHIVNTLGITRESIREIAEKYISDTIMKHLRKMDESGDFDRLFSSTFERWYDKTQRNYRYKGVSLEQYLIEQAKASAKDFINNKIEIKIKDPGGDPGKK